MDGDGVRAAQNQLLRTKLDLAGFGECASNGKLRGISHHLNKARAQ